MKIRRIHLLRVLGIGGTLVATGAVWGLLHAEAEAQEPVLSSAPLFGNATVSGFVLDAESGRPVKGATITPEPDFGQTQANQQGLYVIDAGYSYGLLTLRGAAPGFRQVKSACVSLRPGSNGFGDVAMIREDTQPSSDCSPACGQGEQCLGGVCASACNPVCPCHQLCSAGTCVDNPDLPPADRCGANSRPLGGGACGCNPGFVPNANGVACVEPNPNQSCPPGATSTAFGCQCTDGKLYSELEQACLPADEAAIVSPIGSGVVTAQWRTPGKRPSGIAFDGTKYWLVDNVTQNLQSVALTPGATDAEVLSTFALGEPGSRVIDVDALGGNIFLLVQAPTARDNPDILRFDPGTSSLTSLAPPEVELVSAVFSDGSALFTLSGYRGIQVRDQLGAIAAPARLTTPPFELSDFIVDTAALPQGFAGARYGAFTLNQFIAFRGIAYDTLKFTAHFQVFNAVNKAQAKTLPPAAIELPGSQVRGFDAFGSTGWVVVAGVPLDHAVIAEVQFGSR